MPNRNSFFNSWAHFLARFVENILYRIKAETDDRRYFCKARWSRFFPLLYNDHLTFIIFLLQISKVSIYIPFFDAKIVLELYTNPRTYPVKLVGDGCSPPVIQCSFIPLRFSILGNDYGGLGDRVGIPSPIPTIYVTAKINKTLLFTHACSYFAKVTLHVSNFYLIVLMSVRMFFHNYTCTLSLLSSLSPLLLASASCTFQLILFTRLSLTVLKASLLKLSSLYLHA